MSKTPAVSGLFLFVLYGIPVPQITGIVKPTLAIFILLYGLCRNKTSKYMKPIYLIVVASLCLLFTSCNRCYRCTHPGDPSQDYCKDHPLYEQARQNNITDIQGQEMDCSPI